MDQENKLTAKDLNALRNAKYRLDHTGTGLVRLPNPDCTIDTPLHFEPAQVLEELGLGPLLDKFIALNARAEAFSTYLDGITSLHEPAVMGVPQLQDTPEANELYGRLIALRNKANAARDTLNTAIDQMLDHEVRHPDTFVHA